jgi:hypothetical protein
MKTAKVRDQEWAAQRQHCRDAYAKGEERSLLLEVTNAWRGLTVRHRSGNHLDLQRDCPICVAS